NQYPLFGNARVLPVKVIWDYAYYWGVLCQLVFQRRLTDLALLGELRPQLERARDLNLQVQATLREWDLADPGRSERRMLDQWPPPWFPELNATLDDALDDAQLRERRRGNVAMLEQLAATIAARAAGDRTAACEGVPLFDD